MVQAASDSSPSIAIIGAGWAGCAAGVELSRNGRRVTVFESTRVAGGRARKVELHGHTLDNGQHIMLGAYETSLRLMKLAGVDCSEALLRLPLQMRYPAGSGMDFLAPRLPAPLHLLVALLRARGLQRADKLALARFSSTVRWMDWRLHQDCTVSELLERFDQTVRLVRLMWRPLCIAALNTPPERASAQVFLNVLRDSLGARRRASDMLLPRQDLSALFPAAAASFIERSGGRVNMGTAIAAIAPEQGRWRLIARTADGPRAGDIEAGAAGMVFDQVILATPPWETARLLGTAEMSGQTGLPDSTDAKDLTGSQAVPALQETLAFFASLSHEPITTCYLQYEPDLKLALPFYALLDDVHKQHWGQFVFDRGHLLAGQGGLLAVVVSASGAAMEMGSGALTRAITAQLTMAFGLPRLAAPLWSRVITEKRATFACTPGLSRPGNDIGIPGMWIAGDYTASAYPATLESAARSGVAAAALALKRD